MDRIEAAKDVAFRIGFSGQSGHLRLEPLPPVERSDPLKSLPDFIIGTPFADICELTDVPEGLIVRTIVRLDETCREFKNAAAIMGNSTLYKKMETTFNAIKRE